MAEHLWDMIGPLEEEADQILDEALAKAKAIVQEAREEENRQNEARKENRLARTRSAQASYQEIAKRQSEQSIQEAKEKASAIAAKAKEKQAHAARVVVERILSKHGNH